MGLLRKMLFFRMNNLEKGLLMNKKVSIVITYLDYCLKFLHPCIQSLVGQTYKNIEIIIVDNTKNSCINEYIRKISTNIKILIVENKTKKGFAENYNKGIEKCTGQYVFVLNPDTILSINCIELLINAFNFNTQIGAISPKLLRMNSDCIAYIPNIIDSAGMYLTKNIRHHDRGAGDVDLGQFENVEYVFGVTGAAMMFSTECLNKIAIKEQYFDEDFEFGREDADISWRLNNYGFKCLYFPKSVVYHVRTAKPGRRSNISKHINYHSVKNRYLLMLNNISVKNYFKYSLSIISRDVFVLGYILLKERSSIPALYYIIKNFKKLYRKRKAIQKTNWMDTSSFWFNNQSCRL